MAYEKFDLRKLERLNDVGRFETLIPERMLEVLGEPSPHVIVEIGAGTGLFSEKFAELLPEATVHAADIEPAMVDWMREHRASVASGHVVPVLSSENNVPLPDAMADMVATINLHHELADPAALYAEAYRLLARGGRILVVDWAPRETPKGPSLHIRATGEELRDVLESAGFVDVREHAGLPWHTLMTARRPL